jgi:branched-chain amino acid transport system permease protein
VITFQDIKRTLLTSLWFVFLTFPIMVIRVNYVAGSVNWRWHNLFYIGFGSFFGGLVWRFFMTRRSVAVKPTVEVTTKEAAAKQKAGTETNLERARRVLKQPRIRNSIYAALGAFLVILPFFSSLYQVNILITAFIYVMLALGLNIVIGLGGMLHLGYIAFYAVGAYTYGILYRFFGIGFWVALPIGAFLATVAGIMLALPVLRLRGDYLAIVTLGFAEIVRIVLNGSTGFSGGPGGIGSIPRPTFFGIEFSLTNATVYIYFLVLIAVLLTIFVVWRFENSRLGRALVAMGEDDIAAEAMGIDLMKTKLTAFALGSLWAGIGGVLFASRTTFINPASFTVWQSIIVLSCVVLGGMGSIPGAIVGALVLILVPEYLRAFSDYRMLMFGAVLVIMMVFRPSGLIRKKRKAYTFQESPSGGEA